MPTKVILMETVDGLGQIGEEVRVADGFARNFLVPQKKAIFSEHASKRKGATSQHAGLMRQLELKRKNYEVQLEKEVGVATEVAAKINEQSLTIAAQAQDDGKLYGSVGAQQIDTALRELGITVDRQKIALPEPIRAVGETTVEIHLHPKVTASVSLTVVALEA
jgi:large subunit ribosomal protein L9